jgi:hypothetical protein
MCNFFSFVTDPVNHPAEYYHFDWEYRKANLDDDGADSHSHICAHFKLTEDVCNKYEFYPLTKRFVIDQINSDRDDSEVAEKWVKRLDFKTVVEPLIVKPIVNPFELPEVERVTDEQIDWLKSWASVWGADWGAAWASARASVLESVGALVRASVLDSVWESVGDLVGALVRASVGASVRASVGASLGASVRASVGPSVGAYISTFFAIEYQHDFSSAVKLWEAGLVPAFDGTVWRLHTGKDARVVYEWTPEVQP